MEEKSSEGTREKALFADPGREETLLAKLERYGRSDFYPLHMPGHKRQMQRIGQPYKIDITEIDGFDNLHHAEGVLLEAQRRAALLYGAEETFYLVNGSTCGILAAVSAAVPRGGRILMARNCHKAAYHAVLLNGLHAEYLYPPTDEKRGMNGSICAEDVRAALSGRRCGERAEDVCPGRNSQSSEGSGCSDERAEDVRPGRNSQSSGGSGCSDERCGERAEEVCPGRNSQSPGGAKCPELHSAVRAVLITSPTYDGIVSDIRAIAEEVHRAGAILIVDEAHGAHFAMDPYFPESALDCGADLVIQSVHKTLPSFTQTALLHVQGPRVDRERLRKYLGVYQTSSPSYVLMAGIDECISLLLRDRKVLYAAFTNRLERMRTALKNMKVLELADADTIETSVWAFDRSKVLISTHRSPINGPALGRLLRERYHLEVEMEAAQYITAIMTAFDTEEGFRRLTDALLEIDAQMVSGEQDGKENDGWSAEAEAYLKSDGQSVQDGEKSDGQSVQSKEKSDGQSVQGGGKSDGRSVLYDETEVKRHSGMTVRNEEVLTVAEADGREQEEILLSESAGRLSAEFVCLYPPGIPLLVPGERISKALLDELEYDRAIGLNLQGLSDYNGWRIRVIR